MNNKKVIFTILGLVLLIFLFVFGITTYHKEKEDVLEISSVFFDETMETAKFESNRCLTEPFYGLYKICCEITEGDKKGLFYECTSKEYQEYFEPNQTIYIAFNPLRDGFLKVPYFLGVYSDLKDAVLLDELDNSVSFNVPDVFDDSTFASMKLLGRIPEGFNLKDFEEKSDSFTLLQLDIYPDNNFNFEDAYALLNVSIPEETEELFN
jgi:hypothetical protein